MSRLEKKQRNKDSDTFFKVQHKHNILVSSLDHALINQSIIYITKTTISRLFSSKPPKTQQVERWQHLKKSSNFLSLYQPREVCWHPQKLCIFRFLCKSYHSCIICNFLILDAYRFVVVSKKLKHCIDRIAIHKVELALFVAFKRVYNNYIFNFFYSMWSL